MISTTHFRILALSVFAVATLFPVLSNARSTAVFDDIIVNEGAAKRGPELKMTSVVIDKVLEGGVVREPVPLMGGERAVQPNTDTLETEKFQTALRLLRDGEKLFVNQQYEVAAQRFQMAMELLEALTFDGALHGLLVSTHIMWGEALVRRGQTSRAREVLGDLIGLSPAITLATNDYPNAFLQMLDEVRLARLEQSSGVLRIRSPRNSVQVSLNKQSLGMLPLEVNAIIPGIHVVRFETGTMGGKTRLVRVGAGEVVELAFELDSLPAITSISPGDALRDNAIDQVVFNDLLDRVRARGAERGIVPIWHYNKAWHLTLLELKVSGTATRTKPFPLKQLLGARSSLENWWKQRETLDIASGWTGVVSGLSVQLALPAWLVAAPAIRASLSNERLVVLRAGSKARIAAILNGDEVTETGTERDNRRRPLSRAELAKKFEGQSYEATQPISLDDLILEDEATLEAPVWKRWWFWTALGGVTAIGVTAIVLAQDAEPSTVVVGVTW